MKFIKAVFQEISNVSKSIIVKFTTFTSNKDYKLTFRKWNYAKALIKLRSDFTKKDYVCLDIDTKASLTNKDFVLKRLLKTHINLITTFLIVKDIKANVHKIKEYVNFSIYLSNRNDFIRLIKIHREIHLIENLKTNMLIKNDILESKDIIIDVQNKKTIIRNCQNIIMKIKIHQQELFVRRNVFNQFVNIISLESYAKISYKVKNLSANRDFLFELFSEVLISIYVYIINARIIEIIVCNKFSKLVKISNISSSTLLKKFNTMIVFMFRKSIISLCRYEKRIR